MDVPDRLSADRPALVLTLDVVIERYRALRGAIPAMEVAAAVKANSHPQLLQTLAGLGASFDVASPAEIAAAVAAGAEPERLEYSHPIKADAHLRYARQAGVTRYSFDDRDELGRLARCCPGSAVTVRLTVDHDGAAWPLADKFGAEPDEAFWLLEAAADAGLSPTGVTFHVGSQQRNPGAYRAALSRAGQVLERAWAAGLDLVEVNIGGGLPSWEDQQRPPDLDLYAAAVADGLRGLSRPVRLVCEPGRYLSADAGRIVSHVIGTATRAGRRWVYLDAGLYHGLNETAAVAVRFSCDSEGPLVPTVLAGPTCDSADVLYSGRPQLLPAGVSAGDTVVFYGVGAYSESLATTFNGFPAPEVIVI